MKPLATSTLLYLISFQQFLLQLRQTDIFYSSNSLAAIKTQIVVKCRQGSKEKKREFQITLFDSI